MLTVVRLELEKRPFAGGHSFGFAGPYERLVGRAKFALDWNDPANAGIVDLGKAPRNVIGLVEFSADLDILKPVDLTRGNRRLLYEVNNRGLRSALRTFCDAAGGEEPTTLAHAGNGFLLDHGYTIVWHGWQGDLLPGRGRLTADLPEAVEGGRRLRGKVRQEYIVDRGQVQFLPLSGSPDIRSYEAVDPYTSTATLTRREREEDTRKRVGPVDWAFARVETDPANNEKRTVPSRGHIWVKDGFQPGWIYELIYETEGSRVMGLGIAGIRDIVSFLRYGKADAWGQPNPLAGTIDRAYAYGASLSARVLRQFVYDGYNADPAGRRVFDAMYVHVSGGGRVFANTRFAQAGRSPKQHEDHQYPSERYPFAYTAVPDPFTGRVDAILKRPDSDPLIIHTHSATEYWQRHGSLGHTDPRTGEDLEMPPNVRMYALSSYQHSGSFGGDNTASEQLPNVMTNAPFLRAMLTLLDRWATQGVPPPPSVLPSRKQGTLADSEAVRKRFPKVPGVSLPRTHSRLPRWDYGPDFDERGIVSEFPPKAVPGQEYPLQVPQVDADGNDLGGLRSPEVEVPVGTHTGWAIRREGYAQGENLGLNGSFVPFARTKKERDEQGDPRLSIEERYTSHLAYIRAIAAACDRLVAQGFLLKEDADRYVRAAESRDPFNPRIPLRPLVLP